MLLNVALLLDFRFTMHYLEDYLECKYPHLDDDRLTILSA